MELRVIFSKLNESVSWSVKDTQRYGIKLSDKKVWKRMVLTMDLVSLNSKCNIYEAFYKHLKEKTS